MTLKMPKRFGGKFSSRLRRQVALGTLRALVYHDTKTGEAGTSAHTS